MASSLIDRSAGGHRLRSWSTGIVAAVILLTPLALGGNRPAVWALSALILFLWGGVHFAWRGFEERAVGADVSHHSVVAALFSAMAAGMTVQILPLAAFLPETWLALPGGIDAGTRISLSPGDTTLALMRWLSYGMMFHLCLQISSRASRAALFLKLLFWIVTAHAFYGLALLFEFGDTILFAEKWAYQDAATGGFVNRNSFATFLALGLVIGVTLLAQLAFGPRRDDRRTWLNLLDSRGEAVYLLAGSLGIGSALALTASRMGMVAALAGCVVVLPLAVLQSQRRFATGAMMLFLLALLAGLSTVAMLYGGALFERLGTLDTAAGIRADLYRQVWSMIMDRPFTGFGGGGFEHAYPLYHQAPVSFDLVWDKTHSTYLALWAEYGLIFGSLPLLIVGCCFARLVRFSREREAGPETIAAIGAIAVAAIHSTVDFSLEIQGVTYLFIAVLAAGLGPISRLPRNNGSASW